MSAGTPASSPRSSPRQAATMASARAPASPMGTSAPLTPGVISSSILAPSLPMTGVPNARLSMTVLGRLSMRDGRTLASAAATTAYNSGLSSGPSNATLSASSPQLAL